MDWSENLMVINNVCNCILHPKQQNFCNVLLHSLKSLKGNLQIFSQSPKQNRNHSVTNTKVFYLVQLEYLKMKLRRLTQPLSVFLIIFFNKTLSPPISNRYILFPGAAQGPRAQPVMYPSPIGLKSSSLDAGVPQNMIRKLKIYTLWQDHSYQEESSF